MQDMRFKEEKEGNGANGKKANRMPSFLCTDVNIPSHINV